MTLLASCHITTWLFICHAVQAAVDEFNSILDEYEERKQSHSQASSVPTFYRPVRYLMGPLPVSLNVAGTLVKRKTDAISDGSLMRAEAKARHLDRAHTARSEATQRAGMNCPALMFSARLRWQACTGEVKKHGAWSAHLLTGLTCQETLILSEEDLRNVWYKMEEFAAYMEQDEVRINYDGFSQVRTCDAYVRGCLHAWGAHGWALEGPSDADPSLAQPTTS